MKLLGNYLPDLFIPRMSRIPAEFRDRGVNAVSGFEGGGREERKKAAGLGIFARQLAAGVD